MKRTITGIDPSEMFSWICSCATRMASPVFVPRSQLFVLMVIPFIAASIAASSLVRVCSMVTWVA